jgi:uncharacterized integral membrane protein
MARRERASDASRSRTRVERLWFALLPALVFLVLLIVFIAQNGQHVEVRFLSARGHIALALALIIAAVAGATVVLLIGSIRFLQIRLASRHRPGRPSGALQADDEAKPVAAESDPDQTRP